MSQQCCCRSPTRCMLFVFLTMAAAVLYAAFIYVTYDRSIDGSQLGIDTDIKEKELINNKKRLNFMETDPRFLNRERGIKDWLQQKPRVVIEENNRENDAASQAEKPSSLNIEGTEGQEKLQEKRISFPDGKPHSRVEMTGETLGKNPDLKLEENKVFIPAGNVSQESANSWFSSSNFSLEFTANMDFGSGSYKAFWVRSEGTFMQRLTAFNKAINDLRSKLVKERGETPYRPLIGSAESFWCNRDDFHIELENYPNARTVALAWKVAVSGEKMIKWDSKKDTSNIILQDYYPWSGSTTLCNWINTPGFTKARWDAVYHKSCRILENITKDIQTESLEPLYLHGKPINKQHYWPNHGLSYPQYFYNTTPPQSLYMHILEDALVTPLGDVLSGNLKLIPYSCSQDLGASPPPDYKTSPVYDEVFIMGQYWGANFFHLMLENMPRVAPYLPFLEANPHILIHAQSREGHTARLLEVLTLNSSRLIQGTIRARRVYLPQATPCGFAQIHSTQLLAKLYFNHIKSFYDSSQRRSILLIRRSGSRRFTQHPKIRSELEIIAREYNLEFQMFIDNPSPSMRDAMVMFRRAVLVVGPHGAGLSNIIYCEPGTLVIEGVCNPPHINMCYQWSAHILGLRYYGIASRRGCETWVDVDYREVVDAAREMLNQKLKAQ